MKDIALGLADTIAQTFPVLAQMTEPTVSQRPAPNKWSNKEIIGHLLDSACNNQQKFVRALLAESGHIALDGYQQDGWVQVQQYQQADWQQLIALWRLYNLQLAFLIEHLPADKLSNTVSVNSGVPLRLDFIVTDYLDHLKRHLKSVL